MQRKIITTTCKTKAMYDPETKQPIKHLEYNGEEWVEAKAGKKPLYVEFTADNYVTRDRMHYYTPPNGSEIHIQSRKTVEVVARQNKIIRVNVNGDPIDAQGRKVSHSELKEHIIKVNGIPVIYDATNTKLFRKTGENGQIEQYYLGEGTEQRIRTLGNINNARNEKIRNSKKLINDSLDQILQTKRKHPEPTTQQTTYTPFMFQPHPIQASENDYRTSDSINNQAQPIGGYNAREEVALVLVSLNAQNVDNNNLTNTSQPSNDQNGNTVLNMLKTQGLTP